MARLSPVPHDRVQIDDAFWAPRQEVNRKATLPGVFKHLKATGRYDAFKLKWKPGKPNPPHKFWDSDVAKWLEAVGFSLATHPDRKLQRLADRLIDDIEKAQQKDGYLNVHYTVVEPELRWKNLRDNHELYCAGHLMEAAVAYHDATGKRKLLDVLCRYADYIDRVFGRGKGQLRGYPGHEEIELALMKLARATGENRYAELARFFVDERGRQPHYYDIEARARGEQPDPHRGSGITAYDYNQSHLPVREQTTVEGHAVRATYLYSGMADVAMETGDKSLLKALRKLWDNCAGRRMYVTGGIGSTRFGERFTFDYDLPNESAYAETCAAIGLVFWAHRMLHLDPDGRYADVMERSLYNGVLSGVSLDGTHFFYVNPLAFHPEAAQKNPALHQRAAGGRQGWFGCACCPPNVARLIASLGGYAYSQSGTEARVHLYIRGRAKLEVAGQAVEIVQKTDYPWTEKVRLAVRPERPSTFTLSLRIPGWCRSARLRVNGKSVRLAPIVKKGYAAIRREWKRGDRVELTLPMPVERVEAHPEVRMDCGRVALTRGPVVYCLEEADNGPRLSDLVLKRGAKLTARREKDLLGDVVVIRGKALRRREDEWKSEGLYRPADSKTETVPIRAVPYSTWANRKLGEMVVWIGNGG